VIAHIDPTGPAAATAARVGDVVVQANGKPVSDAAALSVLVAAHRAGDAMSLDLRDPAGTAKRVDVKALPTPRLIGLSEYGVLANRILLDLRPRLAEASDPFDQSVLRLNIAVALARLGDWRAAGEELQRVKLPDQSGVGNGTVQYLIGLAAEKAGSRAEAEAAFRRPRLRESAHRRRAGRQGTGRSETRGTTEGDSVRPTCMCPASRQAGSAR
jgi:hypothetical protein